MSEASKSIESVGTSKSIENVEKNQKQHNLQALKSLFVDLLEEVKINYVKDIAQGGVERSWEEANQLRRIIRQ